jgi:hypothetical protein
VSIGNRAEDPLSPSSALPPHDRSLGPDRRDSQEQELVQVIRAVLSVLVGDAVDDGIIATNPALQSVIASSRLVCRRS